jgi:hypothetical protein
VSTTDDTRNEQPDDDQLDSVAAAAVFADEMFEILEHMVAAQRRFAHASLDESSRQAVELAVATRAQLADLTRVAADEIEADEGEDVEDVDAEDGLDAEDDAADEVDAEDEVNADEEVDAQDEGDEVEDEVDAQDEGDEDEDEGDEVEDEGDEVEDEVDEGDEIEEVDEGDDAEDQGQPDEGAQPEATPSRAGSGGQGRRRRPASAERAPQGSDGAQKSRPRRRRSEA